MQVPRKRSTDLVCPYTNQVGPYTYTKGTDYICKNMILWNNINNKPITDKIKCNEFFWIVKVSLDERYGEVEGVWVLSKFLSGDVVFMSLRKTRNIEPLDFLQGQHDSG